MRVTFALIFILSLAGSSSAQDYDLLLKGGHVIDARNNLSAIRDVAIKDGTIRAVAPNIPASQALKTVDVSGLYVTPASSTSTRTSTGPRYGQGFRADNSAVYPDGFSFRNGVTTFVDPGGSGWRNFEDMKDKVIDRSRTRVLAFINIVGLGSAGGKYEQDLGDMEVKPTADDGAQAQGADHRGEERALCGAGMGPVHSRGRGRHDRQHPGDGGLRQPAARAPAVRPAEQGLPARRHLHPRLRRQPRRTGHQDARAQPGAD